MAWSDWTDYFEGDIWDITEQYGDDAAAAVQDKIEEYLQEFQDAIDVADSDDEMEAAQDRLEDFVFTQSEAEEIGKSFEDEMLFEYMSRSYKTDLEKIDRYLESIGAGYSGGGGGGGSSAPAPAPAPEPEPDYISDYEDEYYDDYYAWDEWTEAIEEAVANFFETMFGGF